MVTFAGGSLIDAATGQVIGKVARIEATIHPNPMTRRLTLSPMACQIKIMAGRVRNELRMALQATYTELTRLETLRHQAKRKGRPGWRSIKIPKPAKPPHDDRLDAFAHGRGQAFAQPQPTTAEQPNPSTAR